MEFARSWELHADCGPDWLFVRLVQKAHDADPMPEVAEHVWKIAQEYKRNNIIFEVDHTLFLNSHLVGQIMRLHKRCHTASGMFRLCGIPSDAYQVFRAMQLHERLPNYRSREDAVLGRKPA